MALAGKIFGALRHACSSEAPYVSALLVVLYVGRTRKVEAVFDQTRVFK
jgi:hypothetical protein